MRTALLTLALTGLAFPANAADCLMERATYTEPGGWTVAFRPVTKEEELAVSNAFRLTPPGAPPLEGLVTWGNGLTRPIGALTFGCPAEPTEEQQDACTHWSGIIYGVTGGKIDLLARSDEPAHDAIVLSNLGQVLNYSLYPSAAQAVIEDMPWDVFTFAGCAP